MMLSPVRALSFCCALSFSLVSAQSSAPSTIRMVDLNGDGELDLFEGMADGTLVVSLSSGDRHFERQPQELPSAIVTDVVAGDLNGDGFLDLFLVTPQANLGLLGDGTGLFTDATLELGLRDEGMGESALLRDLDDDGLADLLLFNQTGDVLFWGVPGGFERDRRTPFEPAPSAGTRDSSEAAVPILNQGAGEQESMVGPALDIPSRLPGASSGGGVSTGIDPTVPGRRASGGFDSSRSLPVLAPAVSVRTPLPIGMALGASDLPAGSTRKLHQILSLLSVVELPDGLGGMVQTLRVSGANFQVVNGLGVTESLNGLGNLIVGYNELRPSGFDNRTGSHNIVGGNRNNFTAAGGHIVGEYNTVSSEWASVSGGRGNLASGRSSVVSGGFTNTASGTYACVSGGAVNTASARYSGVSGGIFGTASGPFSSISGGSSNQASGTYSSVSGGGSNVASGQLASISGGGLQLASGLFSSISGGRDNIASGDFSAVTGGQYNHTSAGLSSISGGAKNVASGYFSSVSAGRYNESSGMGSSVSGGRLSTASGDGSTVSGGAINTASGSYSSIAGGVYNVASGLGSSVSGGRARSSNGTYNWSAGSYFSDD